MLTNYLKIALRNLLRHKVYSLINISGLAIGMACCLLILLFVQDELSYDHFHEHADQIYRVITDVEVAGRRNVFPITPAPMAQALVRDFPEVLSAVTIVDDSDVLIAYEEKNFFEESGLLADSTFFDVFTFSLVRGDPKTALKEKYSIILTEKMAEKYFGDEDPMDKIIRYEGQYDLKVSGILKKIPANSHLVFDFVIPIQILNEMAGPMDGEDYLNVWLNFSSFTYFRLAEGYSPADLEAKFPSFVERHLGEDLESYGITWNPYLQPLKDIHLRSNFEIDVPTNGDISYIYIFSVIAFFILIIACINFMNLSTARSANRAKEVGLRKVLGAYRVELTKQFLGESILLSFIGLLIAIVLVGLALPQFNQFVEKELAIQIDNIIFIFGLIGIALFVGIVAGSYPAFFLSSFQPVEVLKGKLRAGAKSSIFRMILVVVQFSISIVLIIGTGVVFNQLRYMQNEELGFDKEHLLVMPLQDDSIVEKYDTIKDELLKNPDIVGVTAVSTVPAKGRQINLFLPEGAKDDETQAMQAFMVDHNFIEVMEMKMVEGRYFSADFATDESEAFIINETAVKELDWKKSAVGKQWSWVTPSGNKEGRIIGVVKDFHAYSLHQPIEAMVLHIEKEDCDNLIARIRSDNISATLRALEKKWQEFDPNRPFEYFFLDDTFDELYQAERKLNQLFSSFAILAVFVACLGLFGLTSFTAEQRTKEIGIRKVMGASVSKIVMLLSKEFIKLLLIANLIAIPIAYYAMNKWLEGFAYRINMDWVTFLVAAIIAFVVALLTVTFQAIKAAIANPIESLRYE